jgi:hypothetical protein
MASESAPPEVPKPAEQPVQPAKAGQSASGPDRNRNNQPKPASPKPAEKARLTETVTINRSPQVRSRLKRRAPSLRRRLPRASVFRLSSPAMLPEPPDGT